MSPRADFICQPCHDKGKMPEPVELPVASRKCPLCGKARGLQRLWSGYSPHVTTGQVGRAERLVGPTIEAHEKTRSRNFEVAHGYGVKAVGLNHIGDEMGKLARDPSGVVAATAQQAFTPGASRVKERIQHPGLVHPRQRTQIEKAWSPTPSELAKARA